LPVAFAGSIAVIRDIFVFRLFLVCRFPFGFLTGRCDLRANWSDSTSAKRSTSNARFYVARPRAFRCWRELRVTSEWGALHGWPRASLRAKADTIGRRKGHEFATPDCRALTICHAAIHTKDSHLSRSRDFHAAKLGLRSSDTEARRVRFPLPAPCRCAEKNDF
jgi:hypothetical protein